MFRDRTRNHFYYQSLLAAIWVGALIVFVMQLPDSVPDIALVAALFVMIAISSNIEFTMSRGRDPLMYSPDAQPMTLAIMLVHPVAAMALCGATLLDRYYFQHHIPWYKRAGLAGSVAIAAGVATAVREAVFPDHVPAMYLLVSAFIAALIYEVVATALQALMYQIGVQQSGRELLLESRRMTIISSSLAAISVVVLWNFVSSPVMLVWVFCIVQVATYALQQLTASEAELRSHSEYLEHAFSRYVPARVAEQIAASGEAILLGGEEREITVLFADVRNFTHWSEHETPESVVAQLNEVLGAMSSAIMDFDGTLDKFIGDAVMAFWNAPMAQEDHAARALDAAQSMLSRLDTVNELRHERGLPPFEIGIGIHTGRAVVGNIGHEERLEYTAIGDTVNTAARLEAASKDMHTTLVVSAATWDQAPRRYRDAMSHAHSIRVAGRDAAIEVHVLEQGTPRRFAA